MKKYYDICVAGFWYGANYGSLLNGYAEYRLLKGFGKEVLMLQKPNARPDDPEITTGHNTAFIKKHYDAEDISPALPYAELSKLNDICDCFCAGSDQIWNYTISFHENMYLPFAGDDKKLISFATSLGHKVDKTPDSAKPNVRKHLQRYSAISVREEFDVDILRDNYGLNATLVFEPVFCIDKQIYEELAAESSFNETEPYLLTYILDPTPEKRAAILYYAEKLGLKTVNILDGVQSIWQRKKEILNLPNTIPNVGAEDFLKAFMNASYVITDSFHGSAFSIIFNKPFFAIGNHGRGYERFIDLLGRLKLTDRLVSDPKNIPHDEKYLAPIDYTVTNQIIASEAKRTVDWFRYAVETPKAELPAIKIEGAPVPKPAPQPAPFSYDEKRCQMIAALLRDYGIEHVVLSSGTRHSDLVKFFEANDCFTTHQVIDERSAGFYALGLATKLRKPVVVCCTSGTASSNYLTSMSEAFYQRVPLIYITADRYPYLLNQREDQMVPQDNMFGSVCLKSVSLPTKDDPAGMSVVRRMVCETILEATHNTPGPVHINVPISFMNRKKLPQSAYLLNHVYFNKIVRYQLLPDRSAWKPAVDKLKKIQKTLIVYGQGYRLSAGEQKDLETFASRFNCVICSDHLANAKCSKTVNVFNMLKPEHLTSAIVKELKPDVVITVNGANVSTIRDFVVRCGNVAHWDVAPNGKAADPYKKLTRIFECTPNQFFKRMNFMAGEVQASDSYYQSWKKYEILDDPIPEKYCQKYAVCQTMKRIPSGAMLHLANSNTIRMANSYSLNEGIEVYCNRGTNGIDGSASSFMGQAAVSTEPCYLLIGDLSFFYDMNSLWNKKLGGNIRIMLFNNSGAGLLRFHKSAAITHKHDAVAEGWAKSLGFTYLSSRNKEEFDANIDRFTSDEDAPMFFEVFC